MHSEPPSFLTVHPLQLMPCCMGKLGGVCPGTSSPLQPAHFCCPGTRMLCLIYRLRLWHKIFQMLKNCSLHIVTHFKEGAFRFLTLMGLCWGLSLLSFREEWKNKGNDGPAISSSGMSHLLFLQINYLTKFDLMTWMVTVSGYPRRGEIKCKKKWEKLCSSLFHRSQKPHPSLI